MKKENRGRNDWRAIPLLLFVLLMIAVNIAIQDSSPRKAESSPLYLAVESGLTAFKWNQGADGAGVPDFGSWRHDIEARLEWSPCPWLEKHGVWLTGGFRYQALGHSRWPRGLDRYTINDQTFVDGPRFGIRFRGKLVDP